MCIRDRLKTPSEKEIRIDSSYIPGYLDGVKLAFVSDLHVDFSFKEKTFCRVLKKLRESGADMVVFGGDLLDPPGYCSDEMRKAAAALGKTAKLFAVPGNHEYYYGLKKSAECYKSLGVKLLRNEVYRNGGFSIVGLDYERGDDAEKRARQLVKTLDDREFGIVVSHRPLPFEKFAADRNFLMLSGHLHGGQIFPFHFFVRLVYRRFYGLYRKKNFFLYITSGAGTWGPPMRLLAPSEIVYFTLERKRD